MQHKKRHSRKTVKLMEERSQKASTVWSSRGRWQNTKRQDSITYCRNFPRPQERQESSVYKQSSSSEQTFKKYDKDKEHSSKFSERKKNMYKRIRIRLASDFSQAISHTRKQIHTFRGTRDNGISPRIPSPNRQPVISYQFINL